MKNLFFFFLIFVLAFMVCAAPATEVMLLGPKKYLRTIGAPNVYTDTFTGREGQGTIVVKNGEENGTHRVSSAILSLNGIQVLGPNNFNQNFYEKTVNIALNSENQLSLELASVPDSYLTIIIKQDVPFYQVAYVSTETGISDIFVLVLDPDLCVVEKKRITDLPPYNMNPTWSRDGKKISYRYGPNEVWIMDSGGDNKKRIATSNLPIFPSVWAMDPNYIYGINSPAGDGEVAKFDVSSGAIEMITNVPYYNTQSFDLNRIQDKIAFVRGVEGNGWTNQLYIADFVSNGSDFQNIVLLPAAIPAPHEPKFSPSGSRVMFVVAEPPFYTGIGIVNTDNSGFWTPIPISASGIVGTGDWIDENRIIYSCGSYEEKNIFVLDLRDNSKKQVTFTGGDKFYIAVYRQ